MSDLQKADYRELFETITNQFPNTEKREKLLLSNGMICFSPYVSVKTGYLMKAGRFLQKRRNKAILACMCEVRDLCKGEGIPCVFLKGLCLAALVLCQDLAQNKMREFSRGSGTSIICATACATCKW